MAQLFFEIGIIFVLLLLNGIFAMSEIAMFATRRARLQQLAEEGDSNAAVALKLVESPVRFLSTVQIGITLVGIIAAAFSGATIAEKLAIPLEKIPVFTGYGEPIALTFVVVVLTFLSLLLGELVPKQLGLARSEQIATRIAKPMLLLSKLASPALAILEVCAKWVLMILRVQPGAESPVTVEEIQILIDQGKKAGTVEETEHRMLERVFHLDERRVASLMTPRNNIVWIDADATFDENWKIISTSRHSYFPVCREDLQTILGMLSLKDVLQRMQSGEPPKLTEILLPPLFVPPSMSALKLLEFFKQTGRHIAIVTDEYGTVDGLVTVTDVLESIVGDIPSTGERVEDPAVRRKDGSWLLDGTLPIEDLKRMFHLDELPGEDEGYYHTVGGFMVTHLGRIPSMADSFMWNGLRFEVVDMDGRRVDKVLVVPPKGKHV